MSFKDYFSQSARDKREDRAVERAKENTKQLKVLGWVSAALIAGAALIGYGAVKAVGDALETD